MLAGKLTVHFRLLHLQFGNAGIQGDYLIEDRFGFQADIDRLAPRLVLVQRVLGLFQIFAYLRQLIP
ncbi:hypothetical protein D3C76_978440 [compost metagenome]